MSLEFVPYLTSYQNYLQTTKDAPKDRWSETDYYTYKLAAGIDALEQGWTVSRAAFTGMMEAEDTWIKNGRPYFKVWPTMALELMDVTLDIPARFLCPPFSSFVILVPRGLVPVADGYLTSILVRYDAGADGDASRYVHIVEIEKGNLSGRSVVGFSYTKDSNLEELILANTEEEEKLEEHGLTPQLIEKIIRLTISVCFFGTNQHEVVRPDIPRKYMEKLEKARERKDDARVQEIEKKFSGGFVVGRELVLPAPQAVHVETGETGPRGPLSHSHTRRPHLRMQQKGPRNQPYQELVFVRSTIVKPELPLNPNAKRGFLIPDKK